MDKPALRKKYLQKRQELNLEEVDALSMDIANLLLQLDIWDRTYYHLFLTIASKNEIDTSFILHILQGRDKSIIVPKVNFETKSMASILLQEHTKLVPNSYGVPEPEEGLEVAPKQLDVVFIPLLAYDEKGNRLGYGKGFYDRFLAQCSPDCKRIGLSFFEPEHHLPVLEHDIPLHCCVTPRKIHFF